MPFRTGNILKFKPNNDKIPIEIRNNIFIITYFGKESADSRCFDGEVHVKITDVTKRYYELLQRANC